MKIFLHEITQQTLELEFDEREPDLLSAVQKVDERGEESTQLPKKRKIKAFFSLRKVDDIAVITGSIDTFVELLCSRCATVFAFPCCTQYSSLFCKDPDMAGIAHLFRPSNHPLASKKPVGQNQGFARHAHDADGDTSAAAHLDITYLPNSFIDLAEVVREQLQLQVPFQPLCRENCRGICPQCGTDLNSGRCACAKLRSKSPFSVLGNFKGGRNGAND